MISQEKQIRLGTWLFSIFIHAALFVQFTNMNVSSQAQAPQIATRISLNLLPPPKQQQQVQEIPEPKRPRQAEAKRIIKKKKLQQLQHEKAIAPKRAKEVQRQQDDVPTKQRFLARILTHIEGYKYYPRAARQRGIEGSIQVSFRLLKNGDISGLTANNGHLILRRAAKAAVNKALPLPACPPEVACPMQVSYAMQFELR